MPRQFGRNRRVADQVQRELAAMLQRETSDPRWGLVTISAVEISPDLKNARVFVTCMGGKAGVNELVRNLNDLSGHYRHELAGVLTMRSVPRLRFEFDVSLERAKHLTELIDSLSKPPGDQPQQPDKS
jgi:ribosome-binding factor A